MRPGADETAHGAGEGRDKAGDGFRVIVGPAGDGIDGYGDAGGVFADRPLFPVGVAALVAEPDQAPGDVGVEAGGPGVAPGGAVDVGVGGEILRRDHRGGPVEVVLGEAAADVVDVGGVAVIRTADRDDGFQGGGLMRGDLEAVESAPADPDHGDLAVAPVLRGDPGDGVDAVLLLGGVYSSERVPSLSPVPRMSSRMQA